LLLFFISILPIAIYSVSKLDENQSSKELFKIELSHFKSIKDLTAYIDGVYSVNNSLSKMDTAAYVNITSEIVKRRFYHGISHYSVHENWIAALLGQCFWSHFSAIVEPDDILLHNEALCSQQAIVFTELLKRKGITTRWVGIGKKEGPGHFLSEVYYNKDWHLYDVNKEPNWDKIKSKHNSMNYYLNNKDSLCVIYDGLLNKATLDLFLKEVRYGVPNEFPAKKMLMFHRATKAITYLLPVFFAFLIGKHFLKFRVKRKRIKKIKLYHTNTLGSNIS
jgi:hypothetical protein